MRTAFWTCVLMAMGSIVLIGALPPAYDFTSSQDGDWQVVSTWNESGSPACNTSDRMLIDGDTVTARCAIELSGGGVVMVQNQGYLKIEGGLEVTGNAEFTVGNDAGMRVEGDLTISGQGDFTTNGETDVTGNLVKNGNKSTADGNGTLNLGGTGCSNFSGNGTCNGNAPLPVKLIGFEAKARENGILLSWVTATEKRNDHFLLQRSSNGMDYQDIKRTEGHGTTVEQHRYEYLDQTPPSGDQYYRLVQVDRDGKRTIYGPKTARYEPSEKKGECRMKIVPNPCHGNCKIRFKGACQEQAEKGNLRVQLYDIAGNQVNARMEQGGGFSSEFMIDTEQRLSPGVYVVRAVDKKGAVASEKMKKR